jgi:hypothetical protein
MPGVSIARVSDQYLTIDGLGLIQFARAMQTGRMIQSFGNGGHMAGWTIKKNPDSLQSVAYSTGPGEEQPALQLLARFRVLTGSCQTVIMRVNDKPAPATCRARLKLPTKLPACPDLSSTVTGLS